MTEENFNWDYFVHSVYVDDKIRNVYRYIATADGITQWFLGYASYTSPDGKKRAAREHAQQNDAFEWIWLKKDLQISGKVIEAVTPDSFRFTFGNKFQVQINLKEEGNRTLVTLRQDYQMNVQEDIFSHINCCVAWTFFLTNLKSVIESGSDLRETEVDNETLINR